MYLYVVKSQQGEGVGTAPSADIVNACNGYYCDEWIAKHAADFPNQPHAFTENWPGWFQKWGDPVPHRPASDVAFSVTRWFAKGGTYMNYYMQYGGTTFGRHVGGPRIITSYDYDVAINEYSMNAEPKYSLLRKLHHILMEYSDSLLSQMPPEAVPLQNKFSTNCESHLYGNSSMKFIAFLSNWNSISSESCTFYVAELKTSIEVPAWSVTILYGKADSMLEVFNTKTFTDNITPNVIHPTLVSDFKLTTAAFMQETVPQTLCSSYNSEKSANLCGPSPMEQLSLTNDSTDYLWYTTSIPFKTLNLLTNGSYEVILRFTAGGGGGEIFYIYIDGILAANTGSTGSFKSPETFEIPIILLPDTYSEYLILSVLSVSMGLQNYGPFLEKITVGIISNVTANDYALINYQHTVGLQGESSFDLLLSNVQTDENCIGLCWYRLTFPTPETISRSTAIALDLSSMGKGFFSLNGEMLGRYWNITSGGANGYACQLCDELTFVGPYSDGRCRTGCGFPSQRYYKIPSDKLEPVGQENTLEIFDELDGSQPTKIALVTMRMIDL